MMTRTEFVRQLDEMTRLVRRFGEKSVADVRAAGLAAKGDEGAQEGLLQGRKAAERLRNEIEGNCLDIMLLQQPLVGPDLRFVSGAFRMVSDLSRIDSMSRDVAFIMSEMPRRAPLDALAPFFNEMCEKAAAMVADALDSFVAVDEAAAREVISRDLAVDALYSEAEEKIVELIKSGDTSAHSLPELLMVAKYFERIADSAQRIAAWAVFRATGERILTDDESQRGDEGVGVEG